MEKRPVEINKLATYIVDKATNVVKFKEQQPPQKNQAAVELGRLGGKKGGKRRAEVLTSDRRSEIARLAAQARWKIDKD